MECVCLIIVMGDATGHGFRGVERAADTRRYLSEGIPLQMPILLF